MKIKLASFIIKMGIAIAVLGFKMAGIDSVVTLNGEMVVDTKGE